jgi:anti-sigma-K factor RskA
MNEFACDEIDAVAAELALGILPAGHRAEALRHLSTCPACRDRVDALAQVADQLLLAAPEEEPPIGFESRVLDRIGAERRQAPAPIHRSRRWTVAAVGVAAALVLLAAAVAGMAAWRANGQARHRGVESALVSFGNGKWTCRVAAFAGSGTQPTELVVRIDEPPQSTPLWYTVQAEPADSGAPISVGTVEIKDGRGIIDTSVGRDAGKVRGIRVIDQNGQVQYRVKVAPI